MLQAYDQGTYPHNNCGRRIWRRSSKASGRSITSARIPTASRSPKGPDTADNLRPAQDGPVAGHALVPRAQARLDRDQCRQRHDRRVHHRGRDYDDELNKFYGDGWTQRQPMLVINQLGVTPEPAARSQASTDKGPDFSVNGRIQPVINMQPGEVQLWRIANTSGRSGAFFLGPAAGLQLAADRAGRRAVRRRELSVEREQDVHDGRGQPRRPAGAGADDARALSGASCSTRSIPPTSRAPIRSRLLSVRIKAGDSPSPATVAVHSDGAEPPAFLADITDAEVQGKRTINFASTPPFAAQHTINGKKFDGFENAQTGVSQHSGGMEDHECDGESARSPIRSTSTSIRSRSWRCSTRTSLSQPDDGPAAAAEVHLLSAAQLAPGQCYVDPARSTRTTRRFGPIPTRTTRRPGSRARCPLHAAPRIWWDVFPIPSGLGATDGRKPDHDPNGTTYSSRLLQDAQPLRRLPRLLRAPLPHPGARGPRHDDDGARAAARRMDPRPRRRRIQAPLARASAIRTRRERSRRVVLDERQRNSCNTKK